ncbi:MAG: hypothetical protein MUC44_09535, partial [Beijerinckiaceae bacterium]|nr:hypothetical protein [Beijerinckiaceae bacterium]
PVPEGAPLPAEPASAAPADQAALDALFEQELAAARSLAAATESGEADHGSAAGLAGSDGKAPRSAGWRGLLARLLPGGKGRHRAADAGRRKAARPGTGSRAKRQGTGKEQGGAGRRLKGPVGIGIASALILGALIMQRETVVRLAPASATLFGKLGLDVNINGLDFAEIRSTVQREGDQRILVVEGRVISVDQRTVTVPLIEVRVRGADGSTLYAWTTEPPRTSLKPGEALHFRTRLATPPEAGRHVEVRFTDQAQGARART